MALFSHKSQVVCSFPLLHFAICLKWSCDLRQIIASFGVKLCGHLMQFVAQLILEKEEKSKLV